MNLSELKQRIPISDFLARMGIQPARSGRVELSYRAPYRKDSSPSMSVNDRLGLWYDHGSGQGGSVIDLAKLLFQTDDVCEAARRIDELYSSGKQTIRQQMPVVQPTVHDDKPRNYRIIRVGALGRNQLISAYLEERGVLNEAIRSRVVKEVYYEVTNNDGKVKRYFGAGWFNESDGVDIRSKYSKICLYKKDILPLPGESGRLNIFEGMMDFLSALKERAVSLKDYNVILNSLVLTDRLIDRLEVDDTIDMKLFLDHGEAGDVATRKFQQAFPACLDCRTYFSSYGDYNEKIQATLNARSKLVQY